MNNKDIQELNSIESNATKLLFYWNKYDGIPYEGLMLYKGQKCWYRTYDMDLKEMRYSDSDLLKSGYRQDQLDLIDEEDRLWYEETFYYKIYKLTQREVFKIEEQHDRFRQKYGTHTDYNYIPLAEKRDKELSELLDNFFVKNYNRIKRFIYRKLPLKKSISNNKNPYFEEDGAKLFEKNVIGYFKI
jgi:hypothetical protein